METEKEAQEAIQRFNGGQLYGNAIRVNEARPRQDQGDPRDNRGRGGGGEFKRSRGGGN